MLVSVMRRMLRDEPLHPIHGFDRVKPALPSPLGQVLAHPRGLQSLERVQIGAGEPRMLETLRGRQPATSVGLQQPLDAVQSRLRNVFEVRMFEVINAADDSTLSPVLGSGPKGAEAAREHHVENDADAPHVGARGGVGTTHYLGRHKLQRAAHGDRDSVRVDAELFGQAEVDDFESVEGGHAARAARRRTRGPPTLVEAVAFIDRRSV